MPKPELLMNILLMNPYEVYGGTEKIVYSLASIYNQLGHKAYIAVYRKVSDYQFIFELQKSKISSIYEIFGKINQRYSKENIIKKILRQIEQPGAFKKIFTGREIWNYLNFNSITDSSKFMPDIVHFHNLRGGFFGPRLLTSAHIHFPIIITLHDLWILTGKCIQPGKCEAWKNECQNCPEAWFPSFIVRNGIRKNLKVKLEIIKKIQPYICTPSLWAMDMVKKSPIGKFARGLEVINNGIDLSVFKPGNKNIAREKLNLKKNSFILLSSGRDLKTNRYKNFGTLKKVAIMLGNSCVEKSIILLCLGDRGKTEYYGNLEIRFVPFTTDESIVAEFYRAADVYVHTAEYETWGLTITEAMACGTPVVAFSTSGIKEQVLDGKTGFLISNNNLTTIMQAIRKLLMDETLLKNMSELASQHVKKNFDIRKTALKYLEFYRKILNENKKNRN